MLRYKISVSLGNILTIYQALIYAINLCITENLQRQYVRISIFICTGSQGVLKTLQVYDYFKTNMRMSTKPTKTGNLQQCNIAVDTRAQWNNRQLNGTSTGTIEESDETSFEYG